jgi:phosphatidylglycerophosphatase A
MNLLALFISSTFFTGLVPGRILGKQGIAGGFLGSCVAVLFQLWFLRAGMSASADGVLIVISLALGFLSVERAEKYIVSRWGLRKRYTGEYADHDFNETNIDEVHGQAIAALPVFLWPMGSMHEQLILLGISLLFFRVLDVRKPWPISPLEELPGVAGIMLDDSMAGVLAALFVCIVHLSWLLSI